MTTLAKDDVYIGTQDTARAFVLGWQFGPTMLATRCSLEDAISEFDERFGGRVDCDEPALFDYDGDTAESRIETAMNCGDVRINDGGTMVWVDHYEWIREFPTAREAGRFFRGETEGGGR